MIFLEILFCGVLNCRLNSSFQALEFFVTDSVKSMTVGGGVRVIGNLLDLRKAIQIPLQDGILNELSVLLRLTFCEVTWQIV